MNEEYEALKQQLTDYYKEQFSQTSSHTLPVSQEEVDIIKELIFLFGGKEAQEVQVVCWNMAREEYPIICEAVLPDFPFYREGWCKRGD